MQLKNDRLLRAIRREPLDMTPIWIMRQAGRYLQEYRDVRAQAGSFMTLCKTPALACEVTMQPIRRYDLDAAIIFSDILTIPDAMGLGLTFIEGEGPLFTHPLQSAKAINALQVPDLEKLNYVYEAIKLVQQELDGKIPLIGFCGSPWTLAAYMLEGRSVANFPKLKALQQQNPALLHKLLNILAQSVSAHLAGQIKAGVQVTMIFDTWGGMLEMPDYQEFSLNYTKQVIRSLQDNYNNRRAPVILFTKGGHGSLEAMADTGCEMVGLNWEIPLKDARARVGHKVALQGNMNPTCLLESEKVIQNEARRVLASFGYGSGHVFNLGHGIAKETPTEHVAVLVDAVHELSKPYHKEKGERSLYCEQKDGY